MTEALLWTNWLGAICSLVTLAMTGDLGPSIAYCAEYPVSYAIFFVRSMVVYCGVLCFVTLIKGFGVVFATALTTTRKIVTVLISFIFFPKPFTMVYLYGIIVFSIAAGIQLVAMKAGQNKPPSGSINK